LVITRNLSTSSGIQQYLPDRLLYGLIPEALIDEYVFWQSQSDGGIIGFQRTQFTKVPFFVESKSICRRLNPPSVCDYAGWIKQALVPASYCFAA